MLGDNNGVRLLQMYTDRMCVVKPTAHKSMMIGHNKPPKDNENKVHKSSKLFGLKAAWLRFANERELARLAKLHVRIERKERALQDLRTERKVIMNRCIRRMRRASGKN